MYKIIVLKHLETETLHLYNYFFVSDWAIEAEEIGIFPFLFLIGARQRTEMRTLSTHKRGFRTSPENQIAFTTKQSYRLDRRDIDMWSLTRSNFPVFLFYFASIFFRCQNGWWEQMRRGCKRALISWMMLNAKYSKNSLSQMLQLLQRELSEALPVHAHPSETRSCY